MKNKPEISVCMITYNHENFIADAINGVLMQKTSYDLELVIVNDCSVDNTDKVITEILSSHEKGHLIKYHRNDKNLGMMSNFAYAINLCQGKYIALCEGDDYWSDPAKLQNQTDFLKQNNEYVLVGHNAKFIKSDKELDELVRKVDLEHLDFTSADLIKRNPFVSSMVLFKNEGLGNINNVLENFIVGDKPLFTFLSFSGKSRFFSQPVGFYRKHADSVTSKNRLNYKPHKKELINRIKHAEYWNTYSDNKYNAEMHSVKEYRSRVLVGLALRNWDYKTAIYYSKYVNSKELKKTKVENNIGHFEIDKLHYLSNIIFVSLKKTNVDIDSQKIFYDDLWAVKKLNSLDLRRYVKILNYFIDIKRELKNPAILDLGCGNGKLIAILGEFGKAEGLELSKKAVENAKSLYPHVNFIEGDALEYKLNDDFYDLIISQEVIEHVYKQDDYIRVCHNALKTGGYLILTTPNKNVLDHMKDGKAWSNQPIENILSPKQLKQLVSAKFKILDYDSIILNFGDQGVYKMVNSRYCIGIANKLGLKRIREQLLGKWGYGLHQCILATKK